MGHRSRRTEPGLEIRLSRKSKLTFFVADILTCDKQENITVIVPLCVLLTPNNVLKNGVCAEPDRKCNETK